jgi:hypothetical protein
MNNIDDCKISPRLRATQEKKKARRACCLSHIYGCLGVPEKTIVQSADEAEGSDGRIRAQSRRLVSGPNIHGYLHIYSHPAQGPDRVRVT